MRIGSRAPGLREERRGAVRRVLLRVLLRVLILPALLVVVAPVGAASGAASDAASGAASGAASDAASGAPPGHPVRAAVGEGGWQWPVPPHVPVNAYAAPPTRYAAGHRGIDLAVSPGQPVAAPADGVVRFAGVVVDRPVLTLDHGGGVLSSFEPVASDLPVGTPVARGAVVAAVGSGGHCAAGCLHVGVRVDGEYVSPLLFFARVPPAVLLPLGPAP